MAYFLQLLGEFRLTRESGEPISIPVRAQALLAYLSVVSCPVPRQVLAELLSPEGDAQEVRAALRQAVYLSHKAMAGSKVICTGECGLSLNNDLLQPDVQLFQRATAHRSAHSLSQAIELYRGPFLDGYRSPTPAFEEWLAARRDDFLEQMLGALLSLAASEAAAGQHSNALAHARHALQLDPLREDAHRQVMRCLAAMNQRSSALRQYEAARRVLATELDVSPEAETEALREAIARGELNGTINGETVSAVRSTSEDIASRTTHRPLRGRLRSQRWTMAALAAAFLTLSGGAAFWSLDRQQPPASDLPSVAVLRFANVSDDPAHDYLERGVVEEITAMLATHPGLRIVARAKSLSYDRAFNIRQLSEELDAQYLLEGTVQRLDDRIHITAQLIESATGHHLWARRFEEQGSDLIAMQQQIASRVYESLVGFTGAIERHKQWQAWEKSPTSLLEQDYVLRGEQFYFQFTYEANARAEHLAGRFGKVPGLSAPSPSSRRQLSARRGSRLERQPRAGSCQSLAIGPGNRTRTAAFPIR